MRKRVVVRPPATGPQLNLRLILAFGINLALWAVCILGVVALARGG